LVSTVRLMVHTPPHKLYKPIPGMDMGSAALYPYVRKPEASKVMWDGKKRRCCPETVRLKLNRDGGSSGPSRMEGTMVFKKVPTRGTVTFSFGSSGYTGLKLKLGPSAGAWGDTWLRLSYTISYQYDLKLPYSTSYDTCVMLDYVGCASSTFRA
jgi:hypothetical protein